MIHNRILLLCVSVLMATVGCDSTEPLEEQSLGAGKPGTKTGTLAYVAAPVYDDVTGISRIVVHEPGEAPQVLPLDPEGRFKRPRWSPDGSLLLFEGGRDASSVYLAQRDGSGIRPITPGTCDDAGEWSPDGTKIAYSSRCGGSFAAIHVVDLESGIATRLAASLRADLAQWSPHGKRLLFRVWPDSTSDFDLWIMNADGTDMRPLADIEGEKNFGAWSPDGSSVVFSLGPGNDNNLYRVGADGSGLHRLTSTPGLDAEPAWSPDGRQICFISTRDNSEFGPASRLYVMDADGSNQTPLGNAFATDPAWSPDGQRVAYSTASSIQTIDVSTGEVRVIAEEENMFYKGPRFSPVAIIK